MSDENGKVYKVRGHLCAGLQRHLEAATYGCIPRISAEGTIDGCDDFNPVKIAFCPWCGVKLTPVLPEERRRVLHRHPVVARLPGVQAAPGGFQGAARGDGRRSGVRG